MKKILLALMFSTALIFPWACTNSIPTNPNTGFNHAPPSPTATATFSVPTPAYVSKWGTAGGPNALAQGMGTTVFVAEGDGAVSMVEVFDSSNPVAPLAQWTSYGITALGWPVGVAYNGDASSPYYGDVYVLDNANNAVYVYSAAGATVTSWTGYGAVAFRGPEGIAADGNGNIYVADTGNGTVEEFSYSGSPLHQWTGGSYNSMVYTFSQPSAVACDSTGNVYVADAGYNPSSVYLFTPGGVGLTSYWQGIANSDIFGLTVDGSGNIYVSDYGDGTANYGNGLVEEYDSGWNLLRDWGSTQGTNSFGPDGVALSGSSKLVADWNNNLIQVFGP